MLLVVKFCLTGHILVGFLDRRKDEEGEGGGGGWTVTPLRKYLGVKNKIHRVARVYMIQLGYKYC